MEIEGKRLPSPYIKTSYKVMKNPCFHLLVPAALRFGLLPRAAKHRERESHFSQGTDGGEIRWWVRRAAGVRCMGTLSPAHSLLHLVCWLSLDQLLVLYALQQTSQWGSRFPAPVSWNSWHWLCPMAYWEIPETVWWHRDQKPGTPMPGSLQYAVPKKTRERKCYLIVRS